MKKNSLLMFAFLIVSAFGIETVSAQFPIKVPKLPKTEKPKTEQTPGGNDSTPQNQSNQNSSNPNQNRAAQTGGDKHIK
ncbi:MAG: hypothetical protein M3033_11825, partial [Acidobacteriota bacterium]|nr:hypothetical protein [Acidobacteriota bacterium]